MKKFYSILLMAVALLISTNVKADVEVSDRATLQEALNTEVSGSTITLGGDITVDDYYTLYFYRDTDAVIYLDMNGFNITTEGTTNTQKHVNYDNKVLLAVYRGHLNITGSGTLQNTNADADHEVIRVMGTDRIDVVNHTSLTIGENVNVRADGFGGKAITICEIANSTSYSSVPNKAIFNSGYVTSTGQTATKVSAVVTTPITDYATIVSSKGLANGVKVYIYGHCYGSQYAVKVNGNIGTAHYFHMTKNQTTYASKEKFNDASQIYNFATDSAAVYAVAPYVYIGSTAVMNSDATSTDAAAVYSSGYGRFEIAGTVSGATAVYVKSGSVTLDDATISSTGEYTEIVGQGSGVSASGSAIVIESNANFTGESNITINGDTKITSEHGYAIEEDITTASESKTESIVINGGTITGSEDKGAIVITDDTKNSADSIVVYGANITGEVAVGTTGDLSDILSDNVSQTTITVDGKTTVVISTGSTESAGTTTAININELTEDGNYDFSNLDADAISGSTFTVAAGTPLKLGKVILNNPNAAIAIEVPENATLKVEQLTMNATASITVKAGGKLIVSGNQGIYAPSVDNIIIEADGTTYKQGEFYFNPAVTSNRHPNATVRLASKGVGNAWQRFGVSVYDGLLGSNIVKTATTKFYYYGNEEDDWVYIATPAYTFEPFVGYTMQAPSASAGTIYGMPGGLVGNVDAPFNYLIGWNYFANSYSGNMSVDAMIEHIYEHGSAEAAIDLYDAEADTWEAITYADLEDPHTAVINPLGVFTCYNIAEAFKDTISYNNVVWSQANSAAPARRSVAKDWDQIVVLITADNASQKVTLRQGAQFSDEYDYGYEKTKLMQGAVNAYAETANGNMAQVASDNIYGQTITVNTNTAKSFKMTFENLNGKTFAIRDNVTGSVIDMTKNAEYYFTADAYNGENRFEIVEARKMPTDVEVVDADAAKAQKGIYSLVGAYLGENFDVLPAGIYVVNGVKVVK